MFPPLLQAQIENLFLHQKTRLLRQDAETLSHKYRGRRIGDEPLLKTAQEALTYAATRMPATYGAVENILQKIADIFDFSPRIMLDVGAGTGACGWAASSFFALKKLVCLEREEVMRKLGKQIMSASSQIVLQNAQWNPFDLMTDSLTQQADLVTASYVLNELPEDMQLRVAHQLWQATNQVLIIVEPGTPRCFTHLLKIRDYLIKNGAYVIAPCPHNLPCPLAKNDWCHFSARIQRSRLHRQLKNADMGYEDEKYCFMVFAKHPLLKKYYRILKAPIVQKSSISYELCTSEGQIQTSQTSIKDKIHYKKAKKMHWGDILT